MTQQQSKLDYYDVDDLLAEAEAALNAAEVHGFLHGLLGAGASLRGPRWEQMLQEQLQLENDSARLSNCLRTLFLEAVGHYQDDNYELDLLLPEDDTNLSERASALADWCQGYLLGFGLQLGAKQLEQEDVNEALQDLAEITRLDSDIDEDEAMETAYATICEHVRAAVWLIQSEVRSVASSQATTTPPPSLH